MTSAAGAAAAFTLGLPDVSASEIVDVTASGFDLSGWETVVGDGLHAAPGQAAVSMADIATRHRGDASELIANVQERGVMAHNITFRRVIDDAALEQRHVTSFEFRLPVLPSTQNTEQNAQTFEGGFFIWDGSGDRRDHGLGFQWVLNPWDDDFGALQAWSMSRSGWKPASWLEPDTEWHKVSIVLDPRTREAELCVDDICLDRIYTRRQKHSHWGTETAARLQAEIVSLYPGDAQTAPVHTAEVRNWTWRCTNEKA